MSLLAIKERSIVQVYNKIMGVEKVAITLEEGEQALVKMANSIQHHPDFKIFAPRRYRETEKYFDPKILGIALLTQYFELHDRFYHDGNLSHISECNRLLSTVYGTVTDHKMPLMFLDPRFLEAVEKTDFKDPVSWSDLKLPYEAGVFMLPRGFLVSPTDGDIGALVWTRTKTRASYRLPECSTASTLRYVTAEQDAFAILALSAQTNCWYDWCMTDKISSVVDLANPMVPDQHMKDAGAGRNVWRGRIFRL